MNTYKKMYFKMFSDTMDIIEWLEDEYIKSERPLSVGEKYIAAKVCCMLKQCHLNAEEIYMKYGDEEDEIKDRERSAMPGYIEE